MHADASDSNASRRIVLIDDDASSRELFGMLLRMNEFEVDEFETAEEALDAIASDVPAAVLLDITLPGAIDGYECARRLRANPATDRVALVAMTGHALADVKASGARFDAVFRKPVEPDALIAKLHALLSTQPK